MIGSSTDWKLTTTAYAHQRAAIEKLSQLKVGALFMDMGTGKTRTALELIWLRRKRIAKCVWCCPVSSWRKPEGKSSGTRPASIQIFIWWVPGHEKRTYRRPCGILSAWKAREVSPCGLCP